eukprot:9487895-Pyramimonas_sp.AAC.2
MQPEYAAAALQSRSRLAAKSARSMRRGRPQPEAGLELEDVDDDVLLELSNRIAAGRRPVRVANRTERYDSAFVFASKAPLRRRRQRRVREYVLGKRCPRWTQ